MTDLRDFVDVRDAGGDAYFTCDAIVGSEVLARTGLAEEEILRLAAREAEYVTGMAEIHSGSAVAIDCLDVPLAGGFTAKAWLDFTPAPQVVVWTA